MPLPAPAMPESLALSLESSLETRRVEPDTSRRALREARWVARALCHTVASELPGPAAIYYVFKRYMQSGLTAGAVKA